MDWNDLNLWWIWIAGGIVLVILEVFLPVFWFIGLAIGAIIVGILLAVAGPDSWLGGSPAMILLLFSLFSLIAWGVIRKVVGVRKGQLHVASKDVNED